MSKPGKSLKGLCKKLGIRLTVKRGKKRVYKSVKVLKRQCKRKAKKKKKKVKRRRRFGIHPVVIHRLEKDPGQKLLQAINIMLGLLFIGAITKSMYLGWYRKYVKKGRKKKRGRNFGMMVAPFPIHLYKFRQAEPGQGKLYNLMQTKLGGGQQQEAGKKISEHYTSIYRQEKIRELIKAAKDWQNPDPYNFKGVDLKGMDISEYTLSTAGYLRFNNINLKGANLEDSNVYGQIFGGTNLISANLKNSISRAYFRDAKLRGAILYGADLEYANFDGADLRGADLKNIKVNEFTTFNNTDLRGADLRGVDLREIYFYSNDKKPNFKGAIYNDRPITINGKKYEKTYLPYDPMAEGENPYSPEEEGMILDNTTEKLEYEDFFNAYAGAYFGKKKRKKKVKKKVKRKRKKKSKRKK